MVTCRYLLFLAPFWAVGCTQTATRLENVKGFSTPTLVTTADLRIVTDRPNPRPGVAQRVVCTEPSPDVAKALSTLTQGQGALNVSVPIAGVVTNGAATGAGTRATAEQLAQLTERVPPIQALRDGLYRACEAYGNGAIGNNAYALILSRYGELLTTLLLAEATAGEYGHTLAVLQGIMNPPANNAPSAPTISQATRLPPDPARAARAGAPAAGAPAAGAPAAGAPAAGAPAAGAPAATMQLTPPRGGSVVNTAGYQGAKLLYVADGSTSSGGTTPTGAPAARSIGTKATKEAGSSASDGSKPTVGGGAAYVAAIGNNVPAAIETMQYNYLTLNHITPALVLCANTFDPSLPSYNPSAVYPDPKDCRELFKAVVTTELERDRQQNAPKSLSNPIKN